MKKKLEKPVLADGEVTGHAHVLDSEVDVFEVDGGLREFCLDAPATITHEEHKSITLPQGDYVSGKVLEYDHFAEEARAVKD